MSMPCMSRASRTSGGRDPAVGFAGGIVADPAEPIVGQSRRAAAAAGDLVGGLVVDRHLQLRGIARDDLGQLLHGVKIEVLAHVKPIAQRGREQAGAGRGADQRERLERHVDRAGVHPFAQQDVDAKVLHRRIEELLDRLGQPVDLVDEQHRPFVGVGQVGDQVLGGLQHGAAGDLQGHAQVAGNAGGKGGFAQPRRTVEEDVPQRVAPFAGRIDRDLQPREDLALADHVLHLLRAQQAVVVRGGHGAAYDRLAQLKPSVGTRAEVAIYRLATTLGSLVGRSGACQCGSTASFGGAGMGPNGPHTGPWMADVRQERLFNWGYAVCDATMRA